MQAARTGDERYCNWVKDTLALLYLKEGLEVFVDQQANAFHHQLKTAMGAHTCTCTWQDLTRGKRTWEVKNCPSGTCHSWLGLILSHHRNRPFPQLTPENTDPALWPTDYWEVMKVYQPKGCRDQHAAKEADPAGILTTLNKCDHFWPFITKLNDIDDLLQLRNRLMHSSDYLVETPETTNDLQFMLQFLRGLKSLTPAEYQPVQTAIDKIEELRANKLDLSLNRELELKAIRAKQVVIESKVGSVDRLVQTHNTDLKKHHRELQTHKHQLKTHQRKLQTNKTDLQRHKGEHKMHKRELQTQHVDLQTHKKKLKTHHSELQTHKKKLQSHTSELQTHKKKLQSHTSELQTHTSELQSHTSELQTHKKKIQSHTSELQTHKKKLQTHTSELQTNKKKLQSHTSELQTHKKKLQSHTSELQTHKKKLQAHTNELQKNHKDLQTHTSELQKHQKELQTHHGELQANRAELEDHDKRLSTCQTEQQSHQSQLQTHGAKLEDQDTKLLSYQTKLKSHHQKLTNLEERMETPKADNGSVEITEADIADLRTSLIQHYRQHCLKVPNPVIAEEIGMNEIYVRPDIKVLRETKNPESCLLNVQNRKEYGKECVPENASMCKQLFYTDDYKNKQIYVTSDAGMGKTLFCKHITNMWCCAHTDECSGYSEQDFCSETYTKEETDFSSEIDTDEETDLFNPKDNARTEDIARKYKMEEENCKILSDFRTLFYITLRDSMQQYSIAEMIETQILRYIKCKKSLKASDILENEGCLVIIDGLDEWVCPEDADVPHFVHPGIPGRLGSNSNTVYLITTRPWKFDVLNLTSSDVDKHVELVGLNKESAAQLCSKLSKLFSGCQNVHIAWEAIWTELENKDLTGLHTIPVLFTQLICLWFDKQELCQSQVQLYCSMLEMMLKRPDKNLRNRERPVLPKPDVTPSELPDCFSNRPYCQAHQHLLLSLCRVAFEALFNEKREDSLVINSSQSEIFGLDEESVALCLNTGILSQNKVLGKWSVSEKKMSFLHKKVQEFLAAVFITINDDPERVISHIKSFCSTVDTVLEMSQVWMFVSGLRPEISHQLVTDMMTNVVFLDELVLQCRLTEIAYSLYDHSVVAPIHTCIEDCVVEALRNGHCDFCLPLEDFFIEDTTNAECLKRLLTSNITNVKSVHLNTENITADDVDSILCQIQTTTCLQKLSLIEGNTENVDKKLLCKTIVRHNACSSLTCLLLENIEMTTEVSAALCGIVKHLVVFSLIKVELAHEDKEQLASSVSQARALKHLVLMLICTDHGDNCTAVPDLSGHAQLCSISLYFASIENVLFANSVKRLILGSISIPEAQLRQLLLNMSTASHRLVVMLFSVTITEFKSMGVPLVGVVLPIIIDEVTTVNENWERILLDISLSGHTMYHGTLTENEVEYMLDILRYIKSIGLLDIYMCTCIPFLCEKRTLFLCKRIRSRPAVTRRLV